jgi:hypothetical protein
MKLIFTLLTLFTSLNLLYATSLSTQKELPCGPYLTEEACKSCCERTGAKNIEACICECFDGICSYKHPVKEVELLVGTEIKNIPAKKNETEEESI